MGDSPNEPEIRVELAKKIFVEKLLICNECETENTGLSSFCTNCGTDLADAQKKKSNRRLSWFQIFASLTVGLGGWIYYYVASSGYYVGFGMLFPVMLLILLFVITIVIGIVKLSNWTNR